MVKCFPVNTILHKSKCIQTYLCPLCSLYPESHQHALRDCIQIKNIWNSLHPPQLFFDQSYDDWIEMNAKNTTYTLLSIPSQSIFLVAIRGIWLSRNKRLFKYCSTSFALLKNHIFSRAVELWYNSDPFPNKKLFKYCSTSSSSTLTYQIRTILSP